MLCKRSKNLGSCVGGDRGSGDRHLINNRTAPILQYKCAVFTGVRTSLHKPARSKGGTRNVIFATSTLTRMYRPYSVRACAQDLLVKRRRQVLSGLALP